MSTDLDLARRAVVCHAWRWMPGMRLSNGYRLNDDGDMSCARTGDTYGWLPDFDDAPTLGCLLALVREAWGPLVSVEAHTKTDLKETVVDEWVEDGIPRRCRAIEYRPGDTVWSVGDQEPIVLNGTEYLPYEQALADGFRWEGYWIGRTRGTGSSEPEALVCALEAAPPRKP